TGARRSPTQDFSSSPRAFARPSGLIISAAPHVGPRSNRSRRVRSPNVRGGRLPYSGRGCFVAAAAMVAPVRCREEIMSGALVNLIVQILAGIAGGHAAGSTMKNFDLGALGNTIAGAVGGGVGGQLLQMLIPMLASGSGGVDIGSLIGQAVGGGASGAVLTAIVALVKNAMSDQRAS